MKQLAMGISLLFCVASGCSESGEGTCAGGPAAEGAGGAHDRELARLLVKLELKTRAVIAGHYKAADAEHRAWLSRNLILPAAVADGVFHQVVSDVTDGRAWVKMVVEEPRNEHNRGDRVALELLRDIKAGASRGERRDGDAYYYAEPIRTAKTCLVCHGEPRGEPDPFFPQYKKNGWRAGEVVGAVVARVGAALRKT